MAEKGLTDGDRAWLEERFKSFHEDSTRQWQFMTKLNTELATHIAKSDGHRSTPCQTAIALHGDHLEKHHNPTKKIKTLGIWAGTAAAIAEAIHWIHKFMGKS